MKSYRKLIDEARITVGDLDRNLSRLSSLDGARDPETSLEEAVEAVEATHSLARIFHELANRYQARVQRKAGAR